MDQLLASHLSKVYAIIKNIFFGQSIRNNDCEMFRPISQKLIQVVKKERNRLLMDYPPASH